MGTIFFQGWIISLAKIKDWMVPMYNIVVWPFSYTAAEGVREPDLFTA
jgi:hypothetical protein